MARSVWVIACGSMVLSDYLVFILVLYEDQNENEKDIKYHSAEG